jgi:hypothetical protein
VGDSISGRDPPNGVRWDVNELKRWRHDDIDPLKLPVMAYELSELRRDVQAMKRAFYTFAFSVVLAAVTFAFAVFALLGKG